MKAPKVLREQLKEYERAGFNVLRVEPGAGAHFKVYFAELPDDAQILTKNMDDHRAIKNNISMFRRKLRQRTEGKK
jgi:hypothetical protein